MHFREAEIPKFSKGACPRTTLEFSRLWRSLIRISGLLKFKIGYHKHQKKFLWSPDKFHKSVQYIVSQCTTCWEAWPLKSKPRSPYVCSQCSRDKKSPRKFSLENSMIPSFIPDELQNLTQVEEMLVSPALPIMRVYIKPGGQ